MKKNFNLSNTVCCAIYLSFDSFWNKMLNFSKNRVSQPSALIKLAAVWPPLDSSLLLNTMDKWLNQHSLLHVSRNWLVALQSADIIK